MTDFGTPRSCPSPPMPPSSGARTGPPWEQPGAFFSRWIDTAKTILLDPQGGFRNVVGRVAWARHHLLLGGCRPLCRVVLFQLIGRRPMRAAVRRPGLDDGGVGMVGLLR